MGAYTEMTWYVRLAKSKVIRISRPPRVSSTRPAAFHANCILRAIPTGALAGRPQNRICYSSMSIIPSSRHLVSDKATREKLWSLNVLHIWYGLSGMAPSIVICPRLFTMVVCKVRALSAPQRSLVVCRFHPLRPFRRLMGAFKVGRLAG